MSTSEVKAKVLERHARLRDLLQAAARLAVDAQGREVEVAAEIDEVRERLSAELDEHFALEEDTLVPLLREADAWGPVRAQRLLDEHGRQRAELAAVELGGRGGHTPRSMAAALRSVAVDLLRDLDQEERDFLGPEALRDDVTIVDQFGG